MSNSVNNDIPFVPENTLDPAAGLNLSISVIDALLQLAVIDLLLDAPPGSPAEGDRYIVGTTPSGDWVGHANEMARWDGLVWQFYQPFIALNLADGALYKFASGAWTELTSTTGIDSFIGQTDTPAAYTNMAALILAVNATEDGVEFVELVEKLVGDLTGTAGFRVVVNEAEDGLELQETTGPTFSVGLTAERPSTPSTGDQHFDTDLGHPVWYDGAGWVDATGATA